MYCFSKFDFLTAVSKKIWIPTPIRRYYRYMILYRKITFKSTTHSHTLAASARVTYTAILYYRFTYIRYLLWTLGILIIYIPVHFYLITYDNLSILCLGIIKITAILLCCFYYYYYYVLLLLLLTYYYYYYYKLVVDLVFKPYFFSHLL